MRISTPVILWACIMCTATPALSQAESELDALRAELAQMRADYESRIAQLEKRLDEAERKAGEQQANAVQQAGQTAAQQNSWQPEPAGSQMSSLADNSFNPALGVILQGRAWSNDIDPEDYWIPGFPLGGEAGPGVHRWHVRQVRSCTISRRYSR